MTKKGISGAAKVAGIIGWPVSHSLSPRLHGYWLDRHDVDGAYVPLPVHPDDLVNAVRMLPRLGLVGGNVTVPHKEAVHAALDAVSADAERIGAVNTIIVRDDGSLFGTNTDAYGFSESLSAGAPTWSAKSGPAVVLGAGGASRAVMSALLDHGVAEIRLINRRQERAEALAAVFGDRVIVGDWQDRDAVLEGAGVLVNTTTLGMVGQPPLEIDLARLPTTAVVVDIVYRPLITPLLAAAATRGNTTVDGLGMLLHQARAGFHAWFDVDPEVTAELRAAVLDGLGDAA